MNELSDMDTLRERIRSIRIRRGQIEAVVADDAIHLPAHQPYMVAGDSERAYWHLGYSCALDEVLALLEMPGKSDAPAAA